MHPLVLVAPVGAVVGLVFALVFFREVKAVDEGTEAMRRIAGHVREGANAYLARQYRVVAIVFGVVFAIFVVLAWRELMRPLGPIMFVSGGFFSGLCGWIGMRAATLASARTANMARKSLDEGLQVAFRSGAVMGLTVVGFGLLSIAGWYFVLTLLYRHQIFGLGKGLEDAEILRHITETMLTFGIGASMMALFARVGGGIYTKAADVGADLVGKLEAGIPEDDPRNPATIADNVGDNVGDVAGMGADLYESYVGSILATAALGAAMAVAGQAGGGLYVVAPMAVAGLGIILSVVGVFLVRCKEDASQKNLLRALLLGTLGATVLVAVAAGVLVWRTGLPWGIFGSIITGLTAGFLIGQATEWFTADEYRWARGVAELTPMGAAPTVIEGIAVGMLSSAIPVVTVVAAVLVSYGVAGGFSDMNMGLYGVAFAAVGMLSTLGITLATDAYGPVADNAGGNAEMSKLPPEVRERTDALDALGNTTAATGKGFAIGSAALTALALLATYVVLLGTYNPAVTGIEDAIDEYALHILNPMLLGGLFIGAMMAFVFCGLTMRAVGRSAGNMVAETRRQFDKLRLTLVAGGMSEENVGDPDNWPESVVAADGERIPNYADCVEIATAGAQKEMIVPSLLALLVPVAVGLVLGVAGVLGLLAGSLVAGFSLACLLNNGGGTWDNAKKWIEKGNLGGKGSEAHKASVVGDTVGDPFKDTSGPSLNILI
ncbi:MAG: sodium-translocating pyrophosphatase, partial [Candidatus Brocadiia bacterium]|nr:sodium-translocating pyrophosphatase [Candidatus Brocadiia bacterium]